MRFRAHAAVRSAHASMRGAHASMRFEDGRMSNDPLDRSLAQPFPPPERLAVEAPQRRVRPPPP